MKNSIYTLFLISILMSCASSKVESDENLNTLKKAVEESRFEIVAVSANPVAFANVQGLQNLLPMGSNLGSINLIGIENYFKVFQNNISIELPYYGEQQISRGYNSTNVGFSVKGIPESSKIKFDSKKDKYRINYSVKGKDENLNISLVLFSNKKATININSSHRTAISYYGDWKILE